MAAGLLAAAAAQAQPIKPAGKPKVTQVSTDHLRIRYAHELVRKTDGALSFVVEIEPRPEMHVYASDADDLAAPRAKARGSHHAAAGRSGGRLMGVGEKR